MTRPTTDVRAAIAQLLDSRVAAYLSACATIAGAVTAGPLLSQLFYWHDKGADSDGWIYKTRDQWRQETGLTRRQQETARKQVLSVLRPLAQDERHE